MAASDPYNRAAVVKLQQLFPTAAEAQVRLALNLAGGDVTTAAGLLSEQLGVEPQQARRAQLSVDDAAQQRVQRRRAAMAKRRALRRGVSQWAVQAKQEQTQSAAPPAAEPKRSRTATKFANELDALAQLLLQIVDANIDLAQLVARDAAANPAGGDVRTMKLESDGAWTGLPLPVAKAVRLVSQLFSAAFKRNLDKFLDAVAAQPTLATRARGDVVETIGHLLTLVRVCVTIVCRCMLTTIQAERNNERRLMRVRTLIRERQGALKVQHLWLFSGDASKRVNAQIARRRKQGQF